MTKDDKARREEADNLRQVWGRIEAQLRPKIPDGYSLEWTVKNLRGWWETVDGEPVDATHPMAVEFRRGVWADFSSVTLEAKWEQMWDEDSTWLLRRYAPHYPRTEAEVIKVVTEVAERYWAGREDDHARVRLSVQAGKDPAAKRALGRSLARAQIEAEGKSITDGFTNADLARMYGSLDKARAAGHKIEEEV